MQQQQSLTKLSPTARRGEWWWAFKVFLVVVNVLLLTVALAVVIRTVQVPSRSQDEPCPLHRSIATSQTSDRPQPPGRKGAGFHQAITPTSVPNIIERFRRALTFRTITKAPRIYSVNETRQFITFLKQSNYYLESYLS